MKHKKLIGALAGITLGAAALFGGNKINNQIKPEGKTLLHIKQIHLPSFSDCNYKQFTEVKENQEDIYRILSNLVDKGINEVCYEGIFEENKNLMNQSFELEKYVNNFSGNQYNSNITFSGSLSSKELIERGYRDAVNRLGAEGKIKVKTTEDKEKFDNAVNSVYEGLEKVLEKPSDSNKIGKGMYNAMTEEREDAVLNILSQYKGPVLPLVYGADHNFKDNIDKWNKKNSNKKFSLIEVIPRHMKNRGKK
tara:strand:- start:763 stop:1515 length:753 start_codon:yes stop_codon:yes gene_type:complete